MSRFDERREYQKAEPMVLRGGEEVMLCWWSGNPWTLLLCRSKQDSKDMTTGLLALQERREQKGKDRAKRKKKRENKKAAEKTEQPAEGGGEEEQAMRRAIQEKNRW